MRSFDLSARRVDCHAADDDLGSSDGARTSV
jgi:hypothetical protein